MVGWWDGGMVGVVGVVGVVGWWDYGVVGLVGVDDDTP